MKKITLLLAVLLLNIACKKEENYVVFGEEFDQKNIISKEMLLEKYTNMKENDTIELTFQSDIKDVCQKKGCWMNMELSEDQSAFVRFKDYGFFVPLNASGSEAVVKGKAFIDVVTVDQLKHYAKDAGKSQEEIDAITEPKITYAFTAEGVKIKE